MNLASALPPLTLTAALLLAAGTVHAQEPTPEAAPPEQPAPTPEKRPTPDYDGRGGPPKTPGEKALIVPRVLLFPAYVVSEYLVRRPLGAAITYAERAGWPSAIYDFLALGESHPIGVVPFALIDFGFQPSVGL